MAYANTQATQARSNPFKAIWNALVFAMEASCEVSSRTKRIDALMSLSDAELARKGLRRENIIRHVFADRFYI